MEMVNFFNEETENIIDTYNEWLEKEEKKEAEEAEKRGETCSFAIKVAGRFPMHIQDCLNSTLDEMEDMLHCDEDDREYFGERPDEIRKEMTGYINALLGMAYNAGQMKMVNEMNKED